MDRAGVYAGGRGRILLIRIQLAVPRNTFLGPETYNELFTMHGTTMIFFVAMPAILASPLTSCPS
ncbi:MAG: cbb3-type cytochrome c oxidase subunit I [Hymenobacter sp.]